MSTEQETVELVHYEVDRGVAVVTLDSPHNRNALSNRLVGQLLESLRRADEDEHVRVIVLTHTGTTFCAGMDLSEASENTGADAATARSEQLADLLRTILTLGTPVVASIDGHVRAGGMGIIGACDIVVSGPRSTFALTEAKIGVAPSIISLVVLSRLTDRSAARLCLTGEVFDPAEAARIGFVTEAVEDRDAALSKLLTDFRAVSPQGLRETKQLVNHAILAAFDADRARVVEQSTRLFRSEEAAEGMRAFLEKRPPRWAQ
ncbi:MAG: enoyl-CoA hydratase family protein [Intrasporangium sp.]|uniref:enoyl-CoA hydratase family protein n=1 Tax=Intrasporangium sp. TaxID=1925024 RepID=UPI003F7D3F07